MCVGGKEGRVWGGGVCVKGGGCAPSPIRVLISF